MKGAFNLKPPNPRYSHTWDVTVVLKYLKTLGSNNELSMKKKTGITCRPYIRATLPNYGINEFGLCSSHNKWGYLISVSN